MIIKFITILAVSQILLSGEVHHTKDTVGIVGFRWTAFSHRISHIHQGSPAEGVLQIGDEIIAIDGERRKTETRGEPGEPITLTIKRASEVFDVTINRIAVQELQSRSLNKYWGVE